MLIGYTGVTRDCSLWAVPFFMHCKASPAGQRGVAMKKSFQSRQNGAKNGNGLQKFILYLVERR